MIADYQRDVGRAAIDAGADVILGHHAHILKGVDVYKGKPIFYSLCNFAMDLHMDEKHARSKGFREIQKLHPEWSRNFGITYNFPPDSRHSAIVKCVLARRAGAHQSAAGVHRANVAAGNSEGQRSAIRSGARLSRTTHGEPGAECKIRRRR